MFTFAHLTLPFGKIKILKFALASFLALIQVFLTMPVALAGTGQTTDKHSRKHLVRASSVSKHKGSISSKAYRFYKNRKSAKSPLFSPRKAIYKYPYFPTQRKVRTVHSGRGLVIRRSPQVLSDRERKDAFSTNDLLNLKSNAALVLDSSNSEVLFAKNSHAVLPIASITKLMTALVVVEADQNMAEMLEVTADDIDRIKHTGSRLRIGSQLTRSNMLHIALMSSENRAASALGRHYPGGVRAFVRAMNAKANALGMTDTHYSEPTGLSRHNVSSARDLAKLVIAAHQHPLIRQYSTHSAYKVAPGGPMLQYRNSNRLITNPNWDIDLQKTGYIAEAGRCVVMQAMIQGRSVVMIFLNAKGKFSRASDAGLMRTWLERVKRPAMLHATYASHGAQH